MKVISFNKKWSKLKKDLTDKDLELFHSVVDIDGSCGRRWGPGLYDSSPRYSGYWFAVGRCHWNVILPCWLLNNRQLDGKYKIITSEMHSAILNTETDEIYDPTYMVTKSPESETLSRLGLVPQIDSLIKHSIRVNENLFKRFVNFMTEEQREEALDIIQEMMKKHEVTQ